MTNFIAELEINREKIRQATVKITEAIREEFPWGSSVGWDEGSTKRAGFVVGWYGTMVLIGNNDGGFVGELHYSRLRHGL